MSLVGAIVLLAAYRLLTRRSPRRRWISAPDAAFSGGMEIDFAYTPTHSFALQGGDYAIMVSFDY
jgi:hypothetical protein